MLGPLLSLLILDNNVFFQSMGMLVVLGLFIANQFFVADRPVFTLVVDVLLVLLGYAVH
jgi:hypothetical protein